MTLDIVLPQRELALKMKNEMATKPTLISRMRDYSRGDTDVMLDEAADRLEALEAHYAHEKNLTNSYRLRIQELESAMSQVQAKAVKWESEYNAAIANLESCQMTWAKLKKDLVAKDVKLRQFQANIEQLNLAEEGAKEAFGHVVEQKHDAEGKVARMQETIHSQQRVIANFRSELEQLKSKPPNMSIPPGYKLVPVEPTDAMLQVWLTPDQIAGGNTGGDMQPWMRAIRLYKKMLSASPENHLNKK